MFTYKNISSHAYTHKLKLSRTYTYSCRTIIAHLENDRRRQKEWRITDSTDITKRLFEPDRVQRSDLWKFIKLVAPTTERKKWKTKEAIGAYCKKCASEIKYSSGTSQEILRHMERFHPDDIGIHSSHKKRTMHQQTIHQSTKKLKMVNESEAQKGHIKILKWIAESYRPLSIVEDPGFNDVLAFARKRSINHRRDLQSLDYFAQLMTM